ncbi:MAG TPA: YXWGXW repeat-containing protein [Geobacteraceae bacterium]|nr:YXWGXW repeat-containing protein [Geobacteraceae bacterium]
MRIAAGFAGLLLLVLAQLTAPVASSAEVAIGVSVTIAPPALPVYVQPPCPAPGYAWTPGYWAWDPDSGYYWVPGTWILAPFPGALWTPSYWAWKNGVYVWHRGYWGPVVGFYGGINYGFGYNGHGYEGGYWRHGSFYYNRTVNNINTTNITNVYNKTVINNVNTTRVSFNGGPGGATLRPTADQLSAARQQLSPPTNVQRQHELAARSDPKQRAALNHGRPSIVATSKPKMHARPDNTEINHAVVRHTTEPSRHSTFAGSSDTTPKPAGTINHHMVTPTRGEARTPFAARPADSRRDPVRTANRHAEARPAQPRPQMVHPTSNHHAAPKQTHAPHHAPPG